jgi:tetratricopeptide (TPR) repeat protein
MSRETEVAVPLARRSRRRLIAGAAAAVAVLAVGVGAWLWTRGTPPPPPLPDLADVDAEVANAVRAARGAVHANPRSADAWGRLGKVLRAHDFDVESNLCFEEAERLDPREPRWPYLRGRTLVQTDPAAGIPCLRRAVERCGDSPLAPHLLLAEVLMEQGRLDEAKSQLEQAARREPADPRTRLRVRLAWGRLALMQEDWRGALENLEPCLNDAQARKLALNLRAEAWRQLGEPERARAEQRQAAGLPDDPGWPDPFVEEVLRLQQGLRPRLAQADAMIRGGRPGEALALLAETVDRYPTSDQVWLLLGEAWSHVGRTDQAQRAFEEAVRVAPEAAEAWFRLGVFQARLGRQREAADSFRRTIRLKPDHADAHFNLGHRLKMLGDLAGAAEEFRAALRCRPDYGAARDALKAMEVPAGKGSSPQRQ